MTLCMVPRLATSGICVVHVDCGDYGEAAIGFLQGLRRSVQTTFHDTVTDTEVVPFFRSKGLELNIE